MPVPSGDYAGLLLRHTGFDWIKPTGTPVYSPVSGVVTATVGYSDSVLNQAVFY